jgi:hypothetical protein
MGKNTPSVPVAPEHTTVEPVKGNVVRLTAEAGWLLRSKNTGHTFQTTLTAHVAGYEVIKAEPENEE